MGCLKVVILKFGTLPHNLHILFTGKIMRLFSPNASGSINNLSNFVTFDSLIFVPKLLPTLFLLPSLVLYFNLASLLCPHFSFSFSLSLMCSVYNLSPSLLKKVQKIYLFF
uniref:Uncharacterized protein n=1 Tax=Cacopsylla melanoneura TaxID=428564 RepID=A0A8D8Y7C5_9HEMI